MIEHLINTTIIQTSIHAVKVFFYAVKPFLAQFLT